MFAGLKSTGISKKGLYEAVYTISGRFVSIFLVIATTKFLTTFLSEEAYGRLALYNITATLPSMFYFGPLGQGILRYYPIARENGEIGAFHREYNLLFRKGALAVLSAGVILSVVFWITGLKHWSIASLLIAILSSAAAFNTFRYGLQNASRKRTLAMGLETGDRVFQQGLAILLLWIVSRDPLIVLGGYVISSLCFLAINRHYYHISFPDTREAHHPANDHYTKGILNYSWPFVVFGVFFWIQSASERWTLEILQSTEMVGQYAVLNQIGFQSQSLLFGSISYFLFPILFNRAGNLKNNRQLEHANTLNNWYLIFNVLLTAFLFLIFWLFGESVIRLLSHEKYVTVAPFLPLMVLAGGLFNFAQNYSNRYMMALQTKNLILPKVAASVAGILFNLAGAYWFGLKGLIISVVFTQAFYVTMILLVWNFRQRAMSENESLPIHETNH